MKKYFQTNKQVVDLRRINKKRIVDWTFLRSMRDRFFLAKKRPLFFLCVLGGVFVFSFAAFFWGSYFKSTEKNGALEANNLSRISVFDHSVYHLPEKNNPRGLNLVFFADSYPSWDEFDNDVDRIMLGLKTIEPWKSYSQFNVYKVNPQREIEICQVKTDDERKPVLRCSEKINTYLNELIFERFKFIVLSRKDFQSWANVSRIEDSGIFFSLKDGMTESTTLSYSYLFAHLMGHAFGLKDEEKFIIAKAAGEPHMPDGPNCAPDEETAKKWWGRLAQKDGTVGYFKTCCGNENYIKPTEASLMNLGSMEKFVPNYGSVSEEYLGKILDYCFSEKKISLKSDPDFFEQYQEMKMCPR
jgi:hypothetical protein